jgi:3-dehydroquinate synthase
MSTFFEIRSSTANYSVQIKAGLLERTLHQLSDQLVIADEYFSSVIKESGCTYVTLAASEAAKSLDAIPQVIEALRERGANRQTTLIAIGGGVVQDIAGFVASVYMRGVPWNYFPTTLLAMADSCIGGKSSINVGPYKNLIGTFHPPAAVLIDPTLVSTLSDEMRISGLIEAAKICYCHGASKFQEYLAFDPDPTISGNKVEHLLACSLNAKKWFIEIDEFDKAERLLLNFGHTFGHAIESASHFRISHGVGVALGIQCAIELGNRVGRTYHAGNRIHELEGHLRRLLCALPNLSNEIKHLSVAGVVERFNADKKHGADFFTVILVANSGSVEIVRLPKDGGTLDAIRESIASAMDSMDSSIART